MTPNLPTIIVVLVLAGGLATALGRAVNLRREAAKGYREFAQRHDLEFVPASSWHEFPTAEGEIDGREIRLGCDEVTNLYSELHTLPEGMRIVDRPWRGDKIGETLTGWVESFADTGNRTVLTQDAQFDQKLEVTCSDPDAARNWLTPQRRQALVTLFQAGRINIYDGGVHESFYQVVVEPAALDESLSRMLKFSSEFDRRD